MQHVRDWLAFTVGVLITATVHGQTTDLGAIPQQQIELRLYDAVFRTDLPDVERTPAIFLLRQSEDRWLTAWGTTRGINHNVQRARLSNVVLSDTRLALDLVVTVFADARGNGPGQGTYRVELAREPGGILRGDYDGTWDGVVVSGRADATILPKTNSPRKAFVPPRPDEHPRILFRKSDLSRLREKAETALGKAALQAMDGPVGLAFKYQLSGNPDYAKQAIPPIEKMIGRGLVSDQYGNNVGDRLEKTALAYDMCFDVWPDEFKRKVEFYLLWAADGVLRARRDTHQGVNWHVASNWSAPLYTGAAFASMALYGRQGPAPAKPLAMSTRSRIPSAADCRPGRGVKVFDFKSDVMPPDWIFAGGFKTDWVDGDPLEDLGGTAVARPQIGDTVRFGGMSIRFARLPDEKDKGYWQHEKYEDGRRLIDITNAVDREYFSTNFFYCVVRNDEPRWVRFEAGPHSSAIVYLNGVRVADGEVAHIESGHYPMLVQAYIDQINPWGRQLICPRLIEISTKEAEQRIAGQQAQHEAEAAQWRRRHKEWEQAGGLDLRCRDLFERARHMMYLFCREAVGNGGFQAELTHYSGIAEKAPARYMSAHLQMFGYHVSPQPDIESLLPRKMFVHAYPPGDDPRALEINGTPKVDNELFAALFSVVQEKWKPAVLWGWHQHVGFAGDNWDQLVEKRPVLALLHYPLDLQPAAPDKRLPLTWQAEDFGFYGLRNRWCDGDDFICQVFAKAHYIGGWNAGNVGTFRLVGLGHTWAGGSTDRNRHRGEESVVQLPGDSAINHNACGRVTHAELHPDGSGVLSIDLADVYAGRKMRPDGRKAMRLYSRYGNLRRNEAFVDLGITGMRSIGVDYSGLCGEPCLIAIVDRIQGGSTKVWTWQLPKEPSSDIDQTTTTGNSFTIHRDDGTRLYGVFATGQEPVVETRMTTMKGGGGSTSGKTLERPIRGVFATSGNANADVFFVGTIGDGPTPDMRVRGRGIDAVVTVGERRVRFDGGRIVFEAVSKTGG